MDAKRFEDSFRQLWQIIKSEQEQKGYANCQVSFHSPGIIYDEETKYKEELIEKNKRELAPENCNFADPNDLLAAVTQCLWNARTMHGSKLLSEASVYYAVGLIDRKKEKSYCVIHDVLTCAPEKEKQAFEEASGFFAGGGEREICCRIVSVHDERPHSFLFHKVRHLRRETLHAQL